MRLQHNEFAFLEVHVSEHHIGALLQKEVIHHPYGQIAHALFSGEFKYPAICLLAHLRVRYHKQHGIGDIQAGQLMKRRGWQDDYRE